MKNKFSAPLFALLGGCLVFLSQAPTLRAQGAPAWTILGPNPEADAAADDSIKNEESGRVISIAIHPKEPKIVLLGTADGGMLRSNNGGDSFSRLDLPEPPGAVGQSQAVGALAMAPSDPNTVFVGTGQARNANNAFFGVGLYIVKNPTDANPVITGPFNKDASGKDIFTGRPISKIIVNPDDPNTIFVATGDSGFAGLDNFGAPPPSAMPLRGLYRSTNALSATPTFTRVTPEAETVITDLVAEPGNFANVVYTVLGSGNSDGGVYRTTNALDPQPKFDRTFATKAGVNARLAIAKVGTTVTVLLATNEKQAGVEGTLRRSTDGGATFPETITAANGFAGANVNVAIDPNNADVFYLGGSTVGSGKNIKVITETLDGGKTFTPNGDLFTNGVHPDTQFIQVAPSDSTIVYVGGDGGIWKSVKGGMDWKANPPQWLDLNNASFTITQLNSIALHPKLRSFILSGAQDNGSPFLATDGSWVELTGGDGGVALIDQNATANSDVTMYRTGAQDSGKDLNFTRFVIPAASVGKSAKQIKADAVQTTFGVGSGATPNGITASDAILFYNPMALGPGTPNTLYFGTDRLYRSENQGANMTVVSQGPFVAGKEVSAIGISPQDDGVRIVGVVTGQIFATTTGANPLTEVTISNNGQPITNYPSRTVIDPNVKTTAYVTFTGFGLPDAHIWKTTNLDAATPTWTAVGKGIPDAPVDALVIDPRNSNHLYAGTDVGVYNSTDGGATWARYGTGLPRMAVFDLAIQKDFSLLRAGTYGLGVCEIATVATNGPVAANATPGTTSSASNTSSSSSNQAQSFASGAANSSNSGRSDSATHPGVFSTPGTFSNSGAITIADAAPAGTYPATIEVSGLAGVVNKVSVQLTGLSHEYPDDISVLLVGPEGQSAMLMSDAGGSFSLKNVNLTFDDSAVGGLPHEDAITTGKYKPTSFDASETLPSPAPKGPYGTTLSVFNGVTPNGSWKLFVMDDSAGDAGMIAGGWSLTLTTQADATLPSITVNDIRVTQGLSGSAAQFNVQLSKASAQTVTVDFSTQDDTAASPGDYASTSGTVTFSPGDTSQTLTVSIAGTSTPGPEKDFFVNLTNATNAAIADHQAVATIENANVIPDILIDDLGEAKVVDTARGELSGEFTVSLSAESLQEVRVDFATADGTMVAGTDYVANSGTLIFPPGTTELPIEIQLIDENVSKPNGTFFVNLSNAINGNVVKAQGEAVVILDKAPGILAPPEDQAALDGSEANFSVQAEGAEPLTYQWSFKGVPIPNATDSVLNIPKVSAANAGDYSVIVTNAYGMDSADGFSLTVIPRATMKALAGYYQGLIGGATFDPRSVGFLKLYVNPGGVLSGAIEFSGAYHGFISRFDASGKALVTIGAGSARFTIQLQLSESDAGGITGVVTSGGVSTDFFAGRALTGAIPPKNYTVVLPKNPEHSGPAFPQGDGYGVLTVSPSGALHFVGKLGDGSVVTQGIQLAPGGYWAVFLGAYGGAGSASGWVQFRDMPGKSDLDGSLDWFRPDHFQKLYPAGFTTTIDLQGAIYVKPGPGAPVLDLGMSKMGDVTISDGNLAAPLSESIQLDANNHVVVSSAKDRFKITINPANGVFSGSFFSGKLRTFMGAVQQKLKVVEGVFVGDDQSGSVQIAPQPVPVP